ncbi:unknown [Clostridium sp. CAG:306]|nr:unknown [Clostridium sp. CAG:306]
MDSQTILTIIATGILFSGVLYGVYRSIKYDKNIAEQKNRIYVNKPSCNIKFNNNLK